jgi:prolyl-tRNA synthetase
VREAAEALYQELLGAGIEALLDDRDARPGVMFADMELIGIPHRVVIGDRNLAAGQLEYRGRCDSDSTLVGRTDIVEWLRQRLITTGQGGSI